MTGIDYNAVLEMRKWAESNIRGRSNHDATEGSTSYVPYVLNFPSGHTAQFTIDEIMPDILVKNLSVGTPGKKVDRGIVSQAMTLFGFLELEKFKEHEPRYKEEQDVTYITVFEIFGGESRIRRDKTRPPEREEHRLYEALSLLVTVPFPMNLVTDYIDCGDEDALILLITKTARMPWITPSDTLDAAKQMAGMA